MTKSSPRGSRWTPERVLEEVITVPGNSVAVAWLRQGAKVEKSKGWQLTGEMRSRKGDGRCGADNHTEETGMLYGIPEPHRIRPALSGRARNKKSRQEALRLWDHRPQRGTQTSLKLNFVAQSESWLKPALAKMTCTQDNGGVGPVSVRVLQSSRT